MQPGPRKLAAIVAADVAGYSRLVATDDEGTITRWRALRQEVIDPATATHRGRIANTAGDSLLLEFASAVDAVRWALAVQRELHRRGAEEAPDRQIRLRIGVTVGDVIAVGDDLLGDGVNVAARLEALAEPGGLCLSAAAHGYVEGKVDAAFTDGGAHTVKNIPLPVHVWRWTPDAASAVRTAQAVPVSSKPAIAVLPFANLSNDPEQDYFADGITEDVSMALSRFREFAVIAHGSSITFKGSNASHDTVGRELGARYLVEGSVRKAGNRVRVTAKLIDASDGSQLWGERYDRDLNDVFALQDELSAAIVTAIVPRSYETETLRSTKLTEVQLGSWDLLLRARALYAQSDEVSWATARDLLARALQLDPDNAQAHLWLFRFLMFSTQYGWVADIETARLAAGKALQKAVALAPDDAFARATLGLYRTWWRADLDRGLEELQLAVQLNPNLANCHAGLGANLALRGDLAAAREQIDIALRLSPRDPSKASWRAQYCLGALLNGRYEEVVAEGTTALTEFPDSAVLYGGRAAALAQLGRISEAQADVAHVLRLLPGQTVEVVRRQMPPVPNVDRFLEGLRLAGLPEA